MGPDHLLKAILNEKDFGRKTSFEIKLQEMECPKETIQGHTQEETQTLMRYCCHDKGKQKKHPNARFGPKGSCLFKLEFVWIEIQVKLSQILVSSSFIQ